MGSSDTPPAPVPAHIVPVSTVLLGTGLIFWDLCYILAIRRAVATSSSPFPLLALGLNLGWELVYAVYVTEARAERVGFALWLALDLGVVWATLRGPARASDWGVVDGPSTLNPAVGRWLGTTLILITALSCWGNYSFAAWWLSEPGFGYGGVDGKRGKWWRGRDGFDTTELAFWSAAVMQVAMSVGCVAMVAQRGHSGGQSFGIW